VEKLMRVTDVDVDVDVDFVDASTDVAEKFEDVEFAEVFTDAAEKFEDVEFAEVFWDVAERFEDVLSVDLSVVSDDERPGDELFSPCSAAVFSPCSADVFSPGSADAFSPCSAELFSPRSAVSDDDVLAVSDDDVLAVLGETMTEDSGEEKREKEGIGVGEGGSDCDLRVTTELMEDVMACYLLLLETGERFVWRWRRLGRLGKMDEVGDDGTTPERENGSHLARPVDCLGRPDEMGAGVRRRDRKEYGFSEQTAASRRRCREPVIFGRCRESVVERRRCRESVIIGRYRGSVNVGQHLEGQAVTNHRRGRRNSKRRDGRKRHRRGKRRIEGRIAGSFWQYARFSHATTAGRKQTFHGHHKFGRGDLEVVQSGRRKENPSRRAADGSGEVSGVTIAIHLERPVLQ